MTRFAGLFRQHPDEGSDPPCAPLDHTSSLPVHKLDSLACVSSSEYTLPGPLETLSWPGSYGAGRDGQGDLFIFVYTALRCCLESWRSLEALKANKLAAESHKGTIRARSDKTRRLSCLSARVTWFGTV